MNITIAQPSTVQPIIQRLSLAQVLVFHSIPASMITFAFVELVWLTAPYGWPASLALLITWLVVGIPTLLSLLFVYGHQLNGRYSLKGVLLYRQPLSWRQITWLVPGLLLWAALASTLLFPVGESIRRNLFASWPAWLDLSTLAQNPAQYPSSMLWTMVALSAILNLAVPIAEELYFRSFLLPRLPVSARWAPLLSTVLFSLYHFWLPWDVFGRIIALLPVVYVVQAKQNVYLSMLVHCLLNLIGTIGLAVMIVTSAR